VCIPRWSPTTTGARITPRSTITISSNRWYRASGASRDARCCSSTNSRASNRLMAAPWPSRFAMARGSPPIASSPTPTRGDPRLTAQLAELAAPGDRRRLDYDDSCGTVTLYLGLRGIDLRDHGFGSFNVWHYPHDDLARQYDDQPAQAARAAEKSRRRDTKRAATRLAGTVAATRRARSTFCRPRSARDVGAQRRSGGDAVGCADVS